MSESGIWITGFLVLNVVAIFIAWRVNRQLPVSNIETDENEPIENVYKNVDSFSPVSNIETDENEPIENAESPVSLGQIILQVVVPVLVIAFIPIWSFIKLMCMSIVIMLCVKRLAGPQIEFIKQYYPNEFINVRGDSRGHGWGFQLKKAKDLETKHRPERILNLLYGLVMVGFFFVALAMAAGYGGSLNLFECQSPLNAPFCAVSDFFTSLDGGITKIQEKQKIINEINDYQRWRDNRSR